MASNSLHFQGIKRCIQYLDSYPHKLSFILLILIMDQISSGLHGVGIKLHKQNSIECHQDANYARVLNIRRSVLGSINILLGVLVC